MNKVRVVMAEMEGTDEAVLAAIRSFLPETRMAEPIVVAVAPKAIAAPVVELRASASVKRKTQRRTKAAGAESKPKPVKAPEAKPDSCRTLVYGLLKAGPRTSEELIKALPQYTPASIYLALKDLRAAMVVRTREIDDVRKNERVA